jgi:branched-chain amino acid transport system substrate-binding protein
MLRKVIYVAITVVLIVAFSLSFIGCAAEEVIETQTEGTEEEVIETQTLEIGLITALTGPGASIGLSIQRGVEMAVNEINAEGGFQVGEQMYEFQVIAEDDKYTTDDAMVAVEKLVNSDRVKFIFGPLAGGAVIAASPIFTENKVISFNIGSAVGSISPDMPYTFRPFMGSGELIYPHLKYAHDTYGVTKLAAITSDTASGHDIAVDLETCCGMLGMEMVGAEFYARDTTDFYPIVTKILGSNPDVIFPTAGTAQVAVILKALYELGYEGKVIFVASVDPDTLIDAAGSAEAVEGLQVGNILYDDPATTVALKQWWENYKEEYGTEIAGGMPSMITTAYDWVYLLVAGLQAAGTVDDADKIADALENLEYNSPVWGQCEWGGVERYGVNHSLLYPIQICVIQQGEITLAAVIPVSEARFVPLTK